MWLKAVIWRLMSAILFSAVACLARRTISGWPERLDDEVDLPTMEWWEAVEVAAVVCRVLPTFLSVQTVIIAFKKHLPNKLRSILSILQSAEVLTEVQPQHRTGSF